MCGFYIQWICCKWYNLSQCVPLIEVNGWNHKWSLLPYLSFIRRKKESKKGGKRKEEENEVI